MRYSHPGSFSVPTSQILELNMNSKEELFFVASTDLNQNFKCSWSSKQYHWLERLRLLSIRSPPASPTPDISLKYWRFSRAFLFIPCELPDIFALGYGYHFYTQLNASAPEA